MQFNPKDVNSPLPKGDYDFEILSAAEKKSKSGLDQFGQELFGILGTRDGGLVAGFPEVEFFESGNFVTFPPI